MSKHHPSIGILASGSGITAEALIHRTQTGSVQAEVGLVISNNPEAGVFQRVERMNKMYGLTIETACIGYKNYSGGPGEFGEQSYEESEEIHKAFDSRGIGTVVLLGYLRKVRGVLLEERGAKPEHKSPLESGLLNSHPGPLPLTQGTIGVDAQREVFRAGADHSAVTLHAVAEEYDTGQVYKARKVPRIDSDTPETLFEAVQIAERQLVPTWIEWFLRNQRLVDTGAWRGTTI